MGEIAGEGGAWGIAVLAGFMKDRSPEQNLGDYLATAVFAGLVAYLMPMLVLTVPRFREGLGQPARA